MFVFASSAQVYKINDPVRLDRLPIPESNYLPLPAEGQSVYGFLKAAVERYLAGACQTGSTQAISLRLECAYSVTGHAPSGTTSRPTSSGNRSAVAGPPTLGGSDSFAGIVSRARSPEPAVVLTFDNLGEASELERGTWPADRPPGRHPSVTEALPRLLAELSSLGLRATFFIEAINCELNPEAVRSIAEHGHEIGIHGWRHESWDGLEPERERALLKRSRAAYRDLGIDAHGFRPPGGAINAQTPALLRETGCRWASPFGPAAHVDGDGFGWVPFDWALVDAYHLMRRFGAVARAPRRSRSPAAQRDGRRTPAHRPAARPGTAHAHPASVPARRRRLVARGPGAAAHARRPS